MKPLRARRLLGVLGPLLTVLTVSAPVLAQAAPISAGETRVITDYPESITLELDATSSAADIEAVALNLKIRGSGRTDVQPAEFVPGQRVLARYVWKTLRDGVPPGTPAQYWWTIRDGAGNRFETEPETLTVTDSRFTWQTLENEDVALWWYAGDTDFGERIFGSAARALESMKSHTGLSLPFRIHVVLYVDGNDFGAWHTYRRDWVGGEAYPAMGLTVQIVPPGDSQRVEEWVQRVIPHEIAHLFFYQVTTTPYAGGPPTWLNEGFAQFHEFVSHDMELAWVEWVAERGELIPLRLLSGTFTGDDDRIALMYAESLSAVVHLYETWGGEGMERLLSAYQAGRSTDDALLEATGLDFEGFQQAWWEWLGGSPGAYPTPPRAGIPTMPPLITRAPAPTPVPTTQRVVPTVPDDLATVGVDAMEPAVASPTPTAEDAPAGETPSAGGEGPTASNRRAPCLGPLGLAGAVLMVGAIRRTRQAG